MVPILPGRRKLREHEATHRPGAFSRLRVYLSANAPENKKSAGDSEAPGGG